VDEDRHRQRAAALLRAHLPLQGQAGGGDGGWLADRQRGGGWQQGQPRGCERVCCRVGHGA